jgi:putative tricarboxylic transport membrane protein
MTTPRHPDPAPDPAPTRPEPPGMPWRTGRGELVIAAVLALVGAVLVVGNLTMDVVGDGGLLGPQGFGWLVAVVAFAVAVSITVSVLRRDPAERRRAAAEEAANLPALLTCIAGLLAFTALLEPVGWLVMATALFTAVALALGARPVIRVVAIGFVLVGTIQIVFSGVLGLNLPAGVLGGL